MRLHASDVSYDGAQAPGERAGAKGRWQRRDRGRAEPELAASELIHPPSAEPDRSSVALLAERPGRRGGEGGASARHPANGSGGSRSSTTIAGCFSGAGLRDRERSQRGTRALCEPAAGRLHLGYIHTGALVTPFFFSLRVLTEPADSCIDAETAEKS